MFIVQPPKVRVSLYDWCSQHYVASSGLQCVADPADGRAILYLVVYPCKYSQS